MSGTSFQPRTDKERSVWLKTFNAKFPGYSVTFGFTAADVTSVSNDTAAFMWSLDMIEIFRSEAKERTAFKNILRSGAVGSTVGAAPSVPTLPPAPTMVPAGIFARISGIVARIKSHPNYTEAIGKDLGIIGVSFTSAMKGDEKPILTISRKGKALEIKYKKGKSDGAYLYSRRGNEADFTLLVVVTRNIHKDLRPNLVANQAETREYYAWYMVADEETGQQSDVISITV